MAPFRTLPSVETRPARIGSAGPEPHRRGRGTSLSSDRFWPLLRAWLRPRRGASREKRPPYLGFFAFVRDVRGQGKALPGPSIGWPAAPRNPG